MSLNNFFFNTTGELAEASNWNTSGGLNDSLTYEQTPPEMRQYLLIFRLVLLGIGTFDTLLLLLVYVKCLGIITSSLGVYVAHLSLAALIDMFDVGIWAVGEFGYKIEDYVLPWWAYKVAKLPQFALPTTSLFFLLLAVDRFFATCFAGCHHGCYGSRINATIVLLLLWAGSFFMTFILVFHGLLFPHEELYEHLRFLIAYIGPWVLKLILVVVLFVKRRVVPDPEQSQAFIHRARESLYYALTILILHLLLSAPYYVLQTNLYYRLVDVRLDQWVVVFTYAISQLPIVLNPVLCLCIEPEFRDSLVALCTCSGRSRRDMSDLCDDHAESQPLAPMATSPLAEEKEHFDEAES